MSKEEIVIKEFSERLALSALSCDFDTFLAMLGILYLMPLGEYLIVNLLYMLPRDIKLQFAQYLTETHGVAQPPITTRQ